MPATSARVQTPRAERYLAQLTDHLGQLQHGSTRHGQVGRHVGGDEVGGGHAGPPVVRSVERSQGRARIEFDWGRLVLTATAAELVLHVHAEDAQALARGRELIERRVETIGRREHLTLAWRPTTGS